MIRLGTLELKNPWILAPLESVSDCAFRRLCWQQGAALTFTEMIRARGLARNNQSTIDLIDPWDPEVPTGIQLMCANERELQQALERLDELANTKAPQLKSLQVVDLNFGCPSPDVIRIGAGPALLKRRSKLEAIFKVLKDWRAKTTLGVKAVGAKIRLGQNEYERRHRVYLPIVELANAHLDYLTVHARHARQQSTDKADWSAIREVKEKATIPVIGNGDVFSLKSAQKLRDESGCDAVLIARGAIRTPWVFRELNGLGPALPSKAELDVGERQYFADAERWKTRPKFLEWHAEGFSRLRARLDGKQEKGAQMPKNANLT